MGLEEMTNDDYTSLHSQSDQEPHPLDLISIEVHSTLLSIEGPPNQEIILAPNFAHVFSLPSVEIEKVEVTICLPSVDTNKVEATSVQFQK